MKNRRIIAGTVLAGAALCWALWGGAAKVDAIPAAAAKSAVSAPCAPQTQPTEPSNNIDIEEPVAESETIPVAGSVASPALKTPTVVPTSTLAEEAITEHPAAIPEPTTTEEPTMQPTAEAPQDGMVYVPGFGWLQSGGPCE